VGSAADRLRIGRRTCDRRWDGLFGDVLPDAAAERSRATMWDVPRFAETHRYQAVVVENVVLEAAEGELPSR
jgi:DNA (cytosine-5)-methyltransferase 1